MLNASDITISGGSTGAVKGSVARTGTGIYEVTVSGIVAAGSVSVTVNKPGYNFTPDNKTVSVSHYAPPVAVSFSNLTADGSVVKDYFKKKEGLPKNSIVAISTNGYLTCKLSLYYFGYS